MRIKPFSERRGGEGVLKDTGIERRKKETATKTEGTRTETEREKWGIQTH